MCVWDGGGGGGGGGGRGGGVIFKTSAATLGSSFPKRYCELICMVLCTYFLLI